MGYKTLQDPQFAGLANYDPRALFAQLPTPAYVIDEERLRKNGEVLAALAERTGCRVLLAQKAFSNYDFYPLLSRYLAGTEASDAAVGEIVRQDPEPDMEKKGELPITINVWVSAGEDVGTMPDLTTKPMTYDQAMTILQDLVAEYELNVQPYEETQKEYDDELAVDVIKSTTPAAGAELHKGDTITFVLSRGPQTVPLIDFTNRERAWAEDQLKNVLGLEVEVHEEASDTVEAGLVIRQNPTATTQVPAGSTVELWVSTGPESGGNEDLQMEPLIIALPTDRETAEVQIVVDGVIKVNESVPCRDGNYVYELYGTGTVSVEVYVDGVMDVNNTREVTFGE